MMGDNDAGKSSFIDAFASALGGKRWHDEEPIRRGCEFARCMAVIGKGDKRLKISAKWTAGKEEDSKTNYRVAIENLEDNSRLRKPQDVLESFFNPLAIDPNAFTEMKDKDRAAMLREIAGLDTTVVDQERDRWYGERTLVNRDIETLKGQLAGIVVPPPVPDLDKFQAIDVTKVAHKKAEAIARNAENAALRKQAVVDEASLKKSKEDLERLQTAVRNQEAKVASLTAVATASSAAAKAALDIPLEEFDTFIATAEATNKLANSKKNAQLDHLRFAKQRTDLEKVIAGKQTEADDLTSRVKNCDKRIADMLSAVKMPVEGLSVDGDKTMFNGLPFDQASQSDQIRVAMAISVARHPDLPIVFINNGDLIQDKKMTIIAQWAEEQGVLVLMERRATEGAVGVILEDGHLKAETAAAPHSSNGSVKENGKEEEAAAVPINIPKEEPAPEATVDDEIAQLMADMQ